MRKAFDVNVPKLKPRLRSAVDGAVEDGPQASGLGPQACPPETEAETVTESSAETETETATATATEIETEIETPNPTETPPADVESQACVPEAGPRPQPNAHTAPSPLSEVADVQARRERLEQVKRKVVAAMRPAPAMPELPETPARAGESALVLVRELEAQLTRAREIETALRADLDSARTELAHAASDGRRVAERLRAVEAQVEEKRTVLQEMLDEMRALEEERDSAVARAQALTALDEERQTLLDGLSVRAEQAEKARAEGEAEIGRLGAELDGRAMEAARLRAALAQVTRERDDLARELAQAKRDRDELSEARKALEQVHEALASARAKLG